MPCVDRWPLARAGWRPSFTRLVVGLSEGGEEFVGDDGFGEIVVHTGVEAALVVPSITCAVSPMTWIRVFVACSRSRRVASIPSISGISTSINTVSKSRYSSRSSTFWPLVVMVAVCPCFSNRPTARFSLSSTKYMERGGVALDLRDVGSVRRRAEASKIWSGSSVGGRGAADILEPL